MRRRDAISLIALLPLAAFAAAPAHAIGQDDATDAQSAMMSAASRAAQVRQLRDVPSVGVVDLRFQGHSRFKEGLPDISELRMSAEKNAGGIARLRQALAANPVTRKALESRHVDIGRVVGVKISSRGSLRVFVL